MALSFFKSVQRKILLSRLFLFRKRKQRRLIIQNEEAHLRMMSFNVMGVEGKKTQDSWCFRKEFVASMIRFHRMDLIGLQEPLSNQVRDLQEMLPEYHWYGVGMNDGKNLGSHNAIFWKKGRFDLLDQGFFFLSPTPHVPSLAWGAFFIRGVTWVKLRDKKTKKSFFFFNTHFDYHSLSARNESARLLLKKLKEIAENFPSVIVGDFNLFPELDGKQTYRILTRNDLVDAQSAALFPHHGPTGSWSGFKKAGEPGIKPDYIFVKKKGTVVVSHGILSDSFDGRFPSDHLPVVAEICFI